MRRITNIKTLIGATWEFRESRVRGDHSHTFCSNSSFLLYFPIDFLNLTVLNRVACYPDLISPRLISGLLRLPPPPTPEYFAPNPHARSITDYSLEQSHHGYRYSTEAVIR